MSSFAIRSATADDAIAVLELWNAAGSVPTRTDDVRSIASLLARDPHALLLAEQNGELIGSLIASFDGWRGALFRLAVRPEYRLRGVGRALVAEGERSLRERGAVRITLYAIREESGAVDFWAAAGYASDERTLRLAKNL